MRVKHSRVFYINFIWRKLMAFENKAVRQEIEDLNNLKRVSEYKYNKFFLEQSRQLERELEEVGDQKVVTKALQR